MRPLTFVIIVFSAGAQFALAQDRSTELDKAVEEARAAHLALKEAEKRRDAGVEPQGGERLGTVGGADGGGAAGGGPGIGGGPIGGGPGGGIGGRRGGGSRQSDEYWQRQAELEREVEAARKRYDAAQKRWNDLK